MREERRVPAFGCLFCFFLRWGMHTEYCATISFTLKRHVASFFSKLFQVNRDRSRHWRRLLFMCEISNLPLDCLALHYTPKHRSCTTNVIFAEIHRHEHTVLKMRFGRQRPGGEDVCIKMDQIVTVQLGAVGADMVYRHERTAALSSWSGYLANRYQFNTQILSPGFSHLRQTACGPVPFPFSLPRFSVYTHISTLGCIKL